MTALFADASLADHAAAALNVALVWAAILLWRRIAAARGTGQ